MRTAWQQNTDRRLKRSGFLQGFAMAIDNQMPAAFKKLPGDSLVLSSDQYIKDHLIPAGALTKTVSGPKVTKTSQASVRKGYDAGKRQGINNALKGGTTNIA